MHRFELDETFKLTGETGSYRYMVSARMLCLPLDAACAVRRLLM